MTRRTAWWASARHWSIRGHAQGGIWLSVLRCCVCDQKSQHQRVMSPLKPQSKLLAQGTCGPRQKRILLWKQCLVNEVKMNSRHGSGNRMKDMRNRNYTEGLDPGQPVVCFITCMLLQVFGWLKWQQRQTTTNMTHCREQRESTSMAGWYKWYAVISYITKRIYYKKIWWYNVLPFRP